MYITHMYWIQHSTLQAHTTPQAHHTYYSVRLKIITNHHEFGLFEGNLFHSVEMIISFMKSFWFIYLLSSSQMKNCSFQVILTL